MTRNARRRALRVSAKGANSGNFVESLTHVKSIQMSVLITNTSCSLLMSIETRIPLIRF